MRFIDYNGSGGLDAQDMATSFAVEETLRESEQEKNSKARPSGANLGCATTAVAVVLSVLMLLAVF